MDIYIYIPPTLSIVLIVFFRVYAGYFEYAIKKWARGRAGWDNSELVQLLQRIALDCAVQSNFINSMILAGTSIVLLLARGKAEAFLIITSILYIVVLISLLLWIVRFDPGDLVTSGSRVVNESRLVQNAQGQRYYEQTPVTKRTIKKATWLDWIIVCMNILVITAIAVTENSK